jgi:hypothetical protein
MFLACVESLSRAALLVFCLTLAACSGDQLSTEERVRALIDGMEQSIEAGSVRKTVNFLHADYKDPRHTGRQAAGRTLFGIMQRHRDIHLFTLTKTVELTPQQDSAKAVVFVAMSGIPVESVEALISVKADLYRFDLVLVEEQGEWHILSSRWQRVDPRVL